VIPTEAAIRRHPDRAVPDEAPAILSQGLVAHIGFTIGEQPYVIPLAYHYDPVTPDRLYVHGAQASRTLRHLATGAPVCVSVTLLDGIVYSRDAQNHSLNYRSVVAFGRAYPIADPAEMTAIYAGMTQRYIPDRTAGRDNAPPEPGQLRAALMVAIAIEQWSGKARRGGPTGPHDDDPDAPGTAGVIGLHEVRDEVNDDDDLEKRQ